MNLRDIWAKARGVVFGEKKPPVKNAFIHSYGRMMEEKKKLSPLESDRMLLFAAVTEINGNLKNYADYIVQMAAFCDKCIMNPDSIWAKDIDLDRISRFKFSVDLVVASFVSSGKDYMDKVRREMIVPTDRTMLERARKHHQEHYYDDERIALLREIRDLKADKQSP